MDPRTTTANKEERRGKSEAKYYSQRTGRVRNFVRRFKLINATRRVSKGGRIAGSTDVLIDVTRQRGWIWIVSVVCLRLKISTALITKKE